jgi:hypothetical protein
VQEDKKGNEAVKEKLKQKAKEIGANPETGELPSADAMVMPTFSDKQIPVSGIEGNTTQPDFEKWHNAFVINCNLAETTAQVAQLYKNNTNILNQMKGRDAAKFAECEAIYNDTLIRLQP